MDHTTFIPAVVVSALISGVISYIVSVLNRSTALSVRDRQTEADRELLAEKLNADFQLALRKVDADAAATLSERAWADYALRRDAYIKIAHLISCLFEDGNPTDKPEFHRAAREVRLVGSDGVVAALNAMTTEIKTNGDHSDERYRELFNAMRRDIRKIHTLPPEGTELGDDAFPIES